MIHEYQENLKISQRDPEVQGLFGSQSRKNGIFKYFFLLFIEKENMSLINIILNPILPNLVERTKFLRFLKSVRDTNDPITCIITGGGNTGKSTLMTLARITIGLEYCVHVPLETISLPGDDIFKYRYGSRMGCMSVGPDDTPSKYFDGVGWMLAHPEKFGKRHYFIQGDFEFPEVTLDVSKCIHIHLDNKISILSISSGRFIRDMLDHEQEDIRQEMLELLETIQL